MTDSKNNAYLCELVEKLCDTGSLTTDEYERLISERNDFSADLLRKKAVEKRKEVYGNKIYIRGLIEISNICGNNCLYCGIRAANRECDRYRLSDDEIIECADEGYALGFRTFVMQGGEDGHYTDSRLCGIISRLKEKYPDCAVTLSLGERSYESYAALKRAGADRYLLRHETADREHYGMLHPGDMSYDNRHRCLRDLKALGYQVGCGFMVGSPYQTARHLALDLSFIESFSPEMCGIGPFIPHHATQFADFSAGDVELTCYLLSIIRLIKPNILLPATTALGTLSPDGRERGILSGANVIMPNLSPVSARKKYELYNGKLFTGEESAQMLSALSDSMKRIGYEISVERGDIIQ